MAAEEEGGLGSTSLLGITVLLLFWAWSLRQQWLENCLKDRKPRCVLVTGGANGIGKETAKFLAKNGDKIVVCDVDEKNVEHTCEEINEESGKDSAVPLVFDVRDAEQVKEAALKLKKNLGPLCIDSIANFAGVFRGGPLIEMSKTDLDLVMDVNVKGTLNVIREFFPLLDRAGKDCRIVNIGSEVSYANISAAFTGPYAASKVAIEAFTVSLRQELGSLENPVKVIIVNPGATATAMTKNLLNASQSYLTQHTEKVPDSLWKARLLSGSKLVSSYAQRNSRPPLQVSQGVFRALHSAVPPDRVLVNVSLEMHVAKYVPQWILDFVFFKFQN